LRQLAIVSRWRNAEPLPDSSKERQQGVQIEPPARFYRVA